VPELSETNNYGNSFPACRPTTPQAFQPTLKWEWTNSTTLPNFNQVISAPVVADLNQDNIPDIVFITYYYIGNGENLGGAYLRAISGNDGHELFTVSNPAYTVRAAASPAIADIDNDGLPEILVADDTTRLLAFEHDGTFKWRSQAPANARDIFAGGPSIADLDADGIPEVVIGSTVLNNDGTIRWSGLLGSGDGSVGPLSLVANLDMQGAPEIVAGNTAYRADGSVYWYAGDDSPALPDGFNAIGNFDTTPFPEVVLVRSGVIYLLNYDGSLRWQAAIPGGGGGAPTVADVTGDGIPEIGVAGRSRYAVFKADGTLLWSQETQDYTSQTTGSSVFDFDGNGTAEIIYGDELRLRIYRGVDGYVLWETESPSVTGYELPVIVDVDGDGHADIVKVSNNNYIRGTKNGIQVYSDPNWVATRRIWNQHTYHITNVNDDATIPRVEANSWERYNTYRLNVLTSGCLYRQPDLTVSFGRSESIAGGQLRLTARVGNAGSQSVNVGIPIAFYTNDPRNASSQLLGVTTTGSALLPARFTDVTLVVPDTTIAAPMWVSVDDTGGLQGTVIELDETNNLLNTGIVLSGFITNTPTPTSTFMPTNTPTITPTNTSTPLPISVPGCIVAPLNRATISGQVAITANTALVNGVVEYWPVNEPNTFQTLASGLNIAAGDTLTMFDTTLVANDSYTIRVRGQDTSGNPLNCGVLVTVVGEEKPGRVRFSVTDLTVPIVGLPISIGRTYDSLERTRNGDFGYGWTLDVSNPRLTVNPAHDVTLTMPDGRRTTFFFTPDPLGFGFMLPAYTAEAGVYGKLEAPSCLLANTAGRFFCFPGAEYSPTSYTYTDPYGRKFVMEATGKLASITDLQGNNLTFTPNGILSLSSGQSVVFSRDGQGRITQITDPTGKVYRYDYDAVGDLRTVTLPPVRDENGQSKAPLVQYLYHPTFPHLFQSGIDPRGNTMVAAQYYPDGRLKQETNAVGDTYQYAYDVPNRKTTVTNPDGLGKVETVNDSYGLLLTRKDELNRITTNSYDAKRNLKTVTDALNHTTTYDYDANGHRTKVIDPLNHTVIELTYNQYGGPTTLKNALGTTWSVGYHSNFLPQNVTDMIGTVGGYTWNERGSVLTQTDGNGKTSAFEYDQYGNRTKETNPLSESVTMTYDDMGRMLTRTDARLFTTQYRYDALGKLLEVEDADHNITRYGYDLNGNRTSVTDALNHTTTYQYDAANRLKKTIFPDSSFSETTYDFRGNRVLEIDPRGVKTFHEYDLAGQLRRVTAGYGSVDASTASYDYDDAGRRTALTDGNNRTTFYHYDDAGRLSYTVDPLGYETHSYYDDAGQLIRMVDANLHETRYEYDARGRQRFTIFHDNSYTEQQYDGAGRVMVRFDPARKPTTYTYDDAGRLLTVKNALNHTTSYAYDANGNLVSITDANTYSTTFGYDALGRQSRKTWPDSTYETWQYDAVGNMRFHRLADGNINETRYDTLNRPMLALYYDGQQTSYTYEANSLPKTVTDARGVTTYAYDGQNRVQSITLPDLRSVSYTWDGVGNRASMTSPAGTVNYVYDNANRLKEVREGALLVAGYTYDPVGLRKTLTRANGVTTDYAYDALNRLTDIRHTKVPQNPLASYHYQLGAAGNRLSVTEQDGTVTFWGYDDTYRLTSETRIDQFLIGNGTGTPTPGATATGTLPPTFQPPTNTPSGAPTSTNTPAYTPTSTGTPLPPVPTTSNQWQTLFTYDATGNRLTKTEDGTTVYYRYNNLDQLLCYGDVQTAVNTDCAGQTRQTYDGRGNLSSTSTGGNLTTYGWDARDRMTGATVNGTQVAAFVYDDGGRRLQQTNGTQITNYLWDELSPYGDVIQETDGTGASVASYILGGVELLTQKRGGVTSFYLQDGQMSVRLLTDTSGGVLNRYTYDAFGATRDNAGSTPNVYLYTAQRVVPEFGLYDLRARSYGPDTGRLLQRDLNGIDLEFPLELNRYVYVANDPANFDDPSGYGLYELGVRFIETINQQKARFAMLKVFIGKKMLELCQQRGGDCSPEAIIRAVQELGAKLATDARLLTRQLAVDLGGRDLLRNVTVAVGEIEGRLYYAVNSSASQRVIEAIARLTNTPIDEIIVGDGLHAEVALYNFATSKGAELLAIGISNSGGPCPACSGVFDAVAVPVFFLGRIFIALLGGH
jgi:RHS repeat-associated protein